MKKIMGNKSRACIVVEQLLYTTDVESMLILWNKRWENEDKSKTVYAIEDFDYACKELGFTCYDVARMVSYSDAKGVIGYKDYFRVAPSGEQFWFFDGSEATAYVDVEELADYMVEHVDGCGDKTIQALLDVMAEEV